jgi:hypothetical protein
VRGTPGVPDSYRGCCPKHLLQVLHVKQSITILFSKFEPTVDPVIADRKLQLFVQGVVSELFKDNSLYNARVQGIYHL